MLDTLTLQHYPCAVKPAWLTSTPGVSKVRPGGQSRPAIRFHAARSFIFIISYLWPARIVRYCMTEDLAFLVDITKHLNRHNCCCYISVDVTQNITF